MPMKNNEKFDDASKVYLESLYKDIIVNINHLADVDLSKLGSEKSKA